MDLLGKKKKGIPRLGNKKEDSVRKISVENTIVMFHASFAIQALWESNLGGSPRREVLPLRHECIRHLYTA
jgi:hypothetical protein